MIDERSEFGSLQQLENGFQPLSELEMMMMVKSKSSLNFLILPYRRNQRLVLVPYILVMQRMNCYLSATGTRCPKHCCACTWRDRLLRHRVMWGLKDKHSFSRYDVSSNLSQFCVGALSKSFNCAARRDTVHSYCLSSPGDVTVYQLTVR